MRINQNEIIEEILAHIQQCGGEFDAWCVGTAQDRAGPLFQQRPGEGRGGQPIYREAHTSYAAEEAAERLKSCGLHPDRASLPGRIVFAYRAAESKPAQQAITRNLAA